MDWFKVNSKRWLHGSIRVQMTPEQRGTWADLLALASESRFRDGTLRHGMNQPMSKEYIAELLRIPMELLESTIEVCINDQNAYDSNHRIDIWKDGTIQITNYKTYQDKPEKKESKDD